MKNSNSAERLKKLMEILDIRQSDMAEKTGIPKSAFSMYLSGQRLPKQDRISIIADAYNVDEAWLMGFDVPMVRNSAPQETSSKFINNIYQITATPFPLLGEIACGEPMFASENRDSYVMSGTNIDADFCLKAKGDSMVNARIHDGDIVFIKQQNMVENGEIAAVVVNGDSEATLKRVIYYPEKALLILKAENPAYQDLIYTNDELNQIHILGKAVAFQSDVK